MKLSGSNPGSMTIRCKSLMVTPTSIVDVAAMNCLPSIVRSTPTFCFARLLLEKKHSGGPYRRKLPQRLLVPGVVRQRIKDAGDPPVIRHICDIGFSGLKDLEVAVRIDKFDCDVAMQHPMAACIAFHIRNLFNNDVLCAHRHTQATQNSDDIDRCRAEQRNVSPREPSSSRQGPFTASPAHRETRPKPRAGIRWNSSKTIRSKERIKVAGPISAAPGIGRIRIDDSASGVVKMISPSSLNGLSFCKLLRRLRFSITRVEPHAIASSMSSELKTRTMRSAPLKP